MSWKRYTCYKKSKTNAANHIFFYPKKRMSSLPFSSPRIRSPSSSSQLLPAGLWRSSERHQRHDSIVTPGGPWVRQHVRHRQHVATMVAKRCDLRLVLHPLLLLLPLLLVEPLAQRLRWCQRRRPLTPWQTRTQASACGPHSRSAAPGRRTPGWMAWLSSASWLLLVPLLRLLLLLRPACSIRPPRQSFCARLL